MNLSNREEEKNSSEFFGEVRMVRSELRRSADASLLVVEVPMNLSNREEEKNSTRVLRIPKN